MAQFPNSTGPNSGVWTLEDVYNARIGGNWPDATANRGIFSAGLTPSQTDIMDFVNISSAGNATDFGNLDASLFGCGSVSSSTRGVVGGGGNPANDGVNTLQYVTILTTGNTQDFGDLNANGYTLGGTASGTRGVFAGGKPGNVNTIQYVTINSTGNTSDFGDLTVGRGRIGSGVQSSGTRGIFSGGETPVASNIIDYITIASTGNATDFGDLTNTTSSVCGATSNTITALTSGMSTSTNTIDFVTIASTGNASDFGDLTVGRLYITGMSNVHGGLS